MRVRSSLVISLASAPMLDHASAAADALVLVGHGTRDSAGLDEHRSVVRQIERVRPHLIVETAYLELAEPAMADGIDRAVARGARRVVVQPLLLFAAGHAKRDVPLAVHDAVGRHPDVAFGVGSTLDCHQRVVELSASRLCEALAGQSTAALADTMHLLVGRGSRDAEANSQLPRLARQIWEQVPLGWSATCYLAMTEPSLSRALAVVADMPFKQVVVQPHLLFRGQLLADLHEHVERARQDCTSKRWILTEHLGPDGRIAEAALDRAGFNSEDDKGKASSSPPD